MTAGRYPSMVFGGSFWTGSTDQGLREGFRALGWRIQDIDYRALAGSGSGSLVERVAGRLLRERAKAIYRQQLIRTCERLRPDVFFAVKGWALDVETLREIKARVGRTAVFYPDVDFSHEGVQLEVLQSFDHIVTSKSYHLPYLKGLNLRGSVGFVPHGYSSAAHRPAYRTIGEQEMTADVRHIGNFSAYKHAWTSALHTGLPDCDLRIIGNRWRGTVPDGLIDYDETLNAEYARAIQTARINLAVHYGKTASGWEDLVSTRSFEIPACGGFMLHIDNAEIREYFTPGVEIDVFSTPEEMIDKCRFYLAAPDTRAKMIARASERCVPAYSYDRRAEQIASIVGAT